MSFDKPTEASLNREDEMRSNVEFKVSESPGISSSLMQLPGRLFKRARSVQDTDEPKRHSMSLSEPRMQRSLLFHWKSDERKQRQEKSHQSPFQSKLAALPPSPELQAFAQRCDDVIQRTQQLLERTRAQELLIERAMQPRRSISPTVQVSGKPHKEHQYDTPSKQGWFNKFISPWKGTTPNYSHEANPLTEVTEGVMLPHDTFSVTSPPSIQRPNAPPTTPATEIKENKPYMSEVGNHKSSEVDNDNNNNNNNTFKDMQLNPLELDKNEIDTSSQRGSMNSNRSSRKHGSGRRSRSAMLNDAVELSATKPIVSESLTINANDNKEKESRNESNLNNNLLINQIVTANAEENEKQEENEEEGEKIIVADNEHIANQSNAKESSMKCTNDLLCEEQQNKEAQEEMNTSEKNDCTSTPSPKKTWFGWCRQASLFSLSPARKANEEIISANNGSSNDNICKDEEEKEESEEQQKREEHNKMEKEVNLLDQINLSENYNNNDNNSNDDYYYTNREGKSSKNDSDALKCDEELMTTSTSLLEVTSSPQPVPVSEERTTLREDNDSAEDHTHASTPSLLSRIRVSLQRWASYTSPSKHFKSEDAIANECHQDDVETMERDEQVTGKKISRKRLSTSRTPTRLSRNRSRSSAPSHTANKNRKSVHFVSADKLESVTPTRQTNKAKEEDKKLVHSHDNNNNDDDDSSNNSSTFLSFTSVQGTSKSSPTRVGNSQQKQTPIRNAEHHAKATKANRASVKSTETHTSHNRTPTRNSILLPPAPPPSALKSPRSSHLASARSSVHEEEKEKIVNNKSNSNSNNNIKKGNSKNSRALFQETKVSKAKAKQDMQIVKKNDAKKSSKATSVKIETRKVDISKATHAMSTPTRPSTEHREMLTFIRENTIKRCLSEFTKLDLIHFLRAEGVANPSEELSKKELLAEARALANA